MPIDETGGMRRAMPGGINAAPGSRAALEKENGAVYDTQEMGALFDVVAFAAPFVVVKRKSDGARGTLMFQHSPRFYWGFQCD